MNLCTTHVLASRAGECIMHRNRCPNFALISDLESVRIWLYKTPSQNLSIYELSIKRKVNISALVRDKKATNVEDLHV